MKPKGKLNCRQLMIFRSKFEKRGFFVLLFLFCIAKPADAGGDSALTASQTPDGHCQLIAYVDPANYDVIERYAMNAMPRFIAAPALYAGTKRSDTSEPGLIGDWRDRVFQKLRMYSGPRLPDFVDDGRLPSDNELDEQAKERRIVSKLVLKETLKFTQERIPEVDNLIQALKLEVSNGTYDENAGAETADKRSEEGLAATNGAIKDELSLKTGLRVKIEDGTPGLISETAAEYRKISSFFSVDFDNHNDNSLGVEYVIDPDIHIQVERDITRTRDPLTAEKTNEKSILNLIHLVYKF